MAEPRRATEHLKLAAQLRQEARHWRDNGRHGYAAELERMAAQHEQVAYGAGVLSPPPPRPPREPKPRRSAAEDAARTLAVGPFIVAAFWIFCSWLRAAGFSIP